MFRLQKVFSGMISIVMSDNKNGMNSETASAIRSVLGEVKAAANAAIDSMDESVGRRPTDLARLLDIDMKLGWRLSRLLRADTPGEILHSVAGPAGIRKTISGLQSSGAKSETVDRLKSAFEALQTMITELAGNRSSFETMVTGFGEADSLQLSVDMRRKYFSALCSMIGVQCSSQYRLVVIGTDAETDSLSVAAVHSWFGLRQFTGHGGICLYKPTELSSCTCCSFDVVENLDPKATGTLPLLGEFSEMDRIDLVECPGSIESRPSHFRRVDQNLGIDSDANVTFGQLARNLSPFKQDGKPFFQDCVELRVPCKELVLDFMAAPGLVPSLSGPAMRMQTMWCSDSLHASDERSQLPVEFQITKLRPEESLRVPPQGWKRGDYGRLIGLVSERTAWSLDGFDHFRVSLSFPFMPSKLQTLIPLTPTFH